MRKKTDIHYSATLMSTNICQHWGALKEMSIEIKTLNAERDQPLVSPFQQQRHYSQG